MSELVLRIILFRLMKLQEDGSYVVVGYMKMENGRVCHKTIPMEMSGDVGYAGFRDIRIGSYSQNYIQHDRLDQYTGVDIRGDKVFERDEGIDRRQRFTVELINGSWAMRTKRPRVDFIQDLYRNIKYAKITGVQGVTK